MSWVATAYVTGLLTYPDGKKISKGHKLILFVLADYHNEERAEAWTSLRNMAAKSLYSRSGLIRALCTLEKAGLIRVIRGKNAAKTRIINRYSFIALDAITSDPSTPPWCTEYTTPGDPSTPPLVTPVHHIFPKNLSKEPFQIREKSDARALPVDNCNADGESSGRFKQFTKAYPHRGGRILEQDKTEAIFVKLSPEDQTLAIKAAGHYAAALKVQGLMAKDQNRFLHGPAGREPWREWIEPPVLTLTERPPPPPPKIDPIARGLWRRTYGDPKEFGYV